jgi:arylamine N-acetyltransferase
VPSLVGINAYPNPANRLEGCVNDVYLMSSVLQECGFKPEEIRVVLDNRATTANILERLHWLLDNVKDGDERVLFYSGHGAQIPAYGVHQEVDHLNECLVPYDFDWSPDHAITDKQFVTFYSQLPYQSRFAAIFDCCTPAG